MYTYTGLAKLNGATQKETLKTQERTTRERQRCGSACTLRSWNQMKTAAVTAAKTSTNRPPCLQRRQRFPMHPSQTTAAKCVLWHAGAVWTLTFLSKLRPQSCWSGSRMSHGYATFFVNVRTYSHGDFTYLTRRWTVRSAAIIMINPDCSRVVSPCNFDGFALPFLAFSVASCIHIQ